MSKHKRYEVSGLTEDGDVWAFRTDDRERAEAILEDMKEDLEGVELLDGY